MQENNPFQTNDITGGMDFFQVIGAKQDIDMDTSETSSYASSDTEHITPAEVEAINTEINVTSAIIIPEEPAQEVEMGEVSRPVENLHEETKESAVSKNKKKKKKAKVNIEMGSDDGGENTCTYKSCKTKNEIDPDLAWQVGPQALELDHLDEINPFGVVV